MLGAEGWEIVVRRLKSKLSSYIAVGCALIIVSGCGSETGSPPLASSSASPAPSVSKQAGPFTMDTNLTVVNRSGRDLDADVCHDGYCNGLVTLKQGQSVATAGDELTGWVRSAWSIGNGAIENPYTGELGTTGLPFSIDFRARNPTTGLPWIEARPPNKCQRGAFNGNAKTPVPSTELFSKARWDLDVGDYLQSTPESLCSYSMVATRGGDASGYKNMTLYVYAPDAPLSCWENTPGPVKLPESPDGSWSCWQPGPKPESNVGYTDRAPSGSGWSNIGW